MACAKSRLKVVKNYRYMLILKLTYDSGSVRLHMRNTCVSSRHLNLETSKDYATRQLIQR